MKKNNSKFNYNFNKNTTAKLDKDIALDLERQSNLIIFLKNKRKNSI